MVCAMPIIANQAYDDPTTLVSFEQTIVAIAEGGERYISKVGRVPRMRKSS
jgi:hypothetical protein